MRGRPVRSRSRKRQRRGGAVVRDVLQATLEALAQSGYAALRVEAVAAAAGVNKTTVYRRWPTKDALVQDALLLEAGTQIAAPDTGSLQKDLRHLARGMRALLSTPRGQGLVRMLYGESLGGELGVICERMRDGDALELRSVVRRAIERGELPKRTDPDLLLDVLFATMQDWMLVSPARATDTRIDALVALLLLGASKRRA